MTDDAERITLTRDEYEVLRAGATGIITITAAEYAELRARAEKPAGIDPATHDRCMARMRELEGLLRREQVEHEKEIATMTAALKRYTMGVQ